MISPQAVTVLIVEIIKIIAVIIAIALSKEVSASVKYTGMVSSVIVMGIGAWLLFKSVNCMVYGDCGMFAWILVGVMLVVFVIASVGSIVGIKHFTSLQAELNKQVEAIKAQTYAKLSNPMFVSPAATPVTTAVATPLSAPVVAPVATPTVPVATPAVATPAVPQK
jgi:hypothetical protein